MLNKKSLLYLSTLLILFVCCTAYTKLSSPDPTVAIPPDFSTYKDTILIENSYHILGYSGYIKGYLKRYYTGPYKLILKKDLGKYPVETYRYFFDYEYSTESTTKQKGTSVNPRNTYRNQTLISYNKFFIIDRVSTKEYYVENDERHYSRLLKKYLVMLEKARQGFPIGK